MCGIVGIIAKRPGGFQYSDQEMLRRLLVIDGEFRGLDSTGIFQVQNNRQTFITKSATIPSLLFKTKAWEQSMQRMFSGSRVVIGHNRKSTMGATNSKNAHPFHEENIILVHNGTLHGHRELAKDVEVDSHAVCKAFAAGEAEKVLPTINGAFAFVWWDIQKDRLYAVRNKERPLSIIETEDYIYLASEAWMVYAILQRNGVNRDKIKVIDLEPGELYEFDVFAGKGSYTTTKIELAKEVQHTPFTGSRGTTWTVGKTENRTLTGNVLQAPKAGSTGKEFSIPGMNLDHPAGQSCTKDCGDNADLSGEQPRENVVALFPKFNKIYTQGRRVMVRIVSATRIQLVNSPMAWRVTGHTMHPGLPEVDISGVLTGLQPQELDQWYESAVIGDVSHVTDHMAGPVVHVLNLEQDLTIRTFGGNMGYTEWEYISDKCKCSKCNSEIKITDSDMTFVKRLALGEKARYHIECIDCLDKETKGVKNEKQQPGDSSVQDGQQVESKPGGSTILRLPSPSTANT